MQLFGCFKILGIYTKGSCAQRPFCGQSNLALRTKTTHLNVHQLGQLPTEIIDVHTGPAINIRRELVSKD